MSANAKNRKSLKARARITCPHCKAEAEEEMPTDACTFFYVCPGCERTLQPHAGDCCVFCSYADVPCPPVQSGLSCGEIGDER